MTPLEKIRDWLKTYPGYNILEHFRVDYTDQIPANGAIFPSGLVEVERRSDIMRSIMAHAGADTKAGAIVFSLPVTDTAGMRLMEELEADE